jgi:hypothetical protein
MASLSRYAAQPATLDPGHKASGDKASAAARLDPHAGGRALEQNVAAEAVELGRPAAGAEAEFAGRLDQPAGLDQPAEVLLVQMRPRIASTVFCSSNSVKRSGTSSKIAGWHLTLRRTSPMALASTLA